MDEMLVCDGCGGTVWHDGPGMQLACMPPINVDCYVCANCGATKQVVRARPNALEPRMVSINPGDEVKVSISTDAVTLPAGTYTTDTTSDLTGPISSDIEFKFKK